MVKLRICFVYPFCYSFNTSCIMWSMMFTMFGVFWVMLKTLVDLLACWQGRFGHHCNGVIWKAVSHCLMCFVFGGRGIIIALGL